MAQMLHSAAGSASLHGFLQASAPEHEDALNQLLQLDEYRGRAKQEPSLDNEQPSQWQQWFELAAESRDPHSRLGWFDGDRRCQPPVR
jgi:hypothetical protein